MIFNPSLGPSASAEGGSESSPYVNVCRVTADMFQSSGDTERPFAALVPLAGLEARTGVSPIIWWGPLGSTASWEIARMQLLAIDLTHNPDDNDDQTLYLEVWATRAPSYPFDMQVFTLFAAVDTGGSGDGGIVS